MIAVVTGGAVVGGEFLLAGCKNPDSGVSMVFSEDDLAFLDEIAETILPKTATAGAKDAGVGRFMTVMVNDCYTPQNQEIFHKGIVTLNDECKKMHNESFMKATPEQRKTLLIALDKESSEYAKKKAVHDAEIKENTKQYQEKETTDLKPETKELPSHYFTLMKQLTIFGYFTSEKGRKEGLRYDPVPGEWKAVIDYKKGDKSFAGLG
jgi:hypothetical protein